MVTTRYLENSWRWVLCGLDGTVKTFLDRLATGVSITYALDDTSVMVCDLPSDNFEVYQHASDSEPRVSYGRRMIYGLRREETPGIPPWTCRYSGIATIMQDEAGADEPVTHLTSHDTWTWAKSLPVLMPDGSLPPQSGVSYSGRTGNYIARDIIANAYAWMVSQFGGTLPWNGLPNDGQHVFIDIHSGTFETTEVIPKITFQQGATVADAWAQLCQTGAIDIVLSPIFDQARPGVLAVMNVYNQAGSDRPNAVFGWDMIPNNLVAVDDLRDGTQIENWAQFYAGGVVATDGDGNPYHAHSSGSIAAYGPYWVQKNFAGPSDAPAVGLLAAAEVALRKKGKQTLVIDPAPERAPDPFTQWFLGDTIHVWAGRPLLPKGEDELGSALRAGVRSGSSPSPHRVYAFQVDLADDQTETITQLLLTDPNATI